MKFHHGLVIILSLFFISSASGFFSSMNKDSDVIYESSQGVADELMKDGVTQYLEDYVKQNQIKTIVVIIENDDFPYAFKNSSGLFDGSYVRLIARLSEHLNIPAQFCRSVLESEQTSDVLNIVVPIRSLPVSNQLLPSVVDHSPAADPAKEILGLSNAKAFETLSTQISSEYNQDFVLNHDHINKIRLIEMILILMPITWILLYIYLNVKSEKQGSSDFLTKLPNRRFLEKHKKKYDLKSTIIIYMDLDNLKKINDTVNHKEGDKLIVAFTDKLKAICPKNSIFRVGGDEFIILLKGHLSPFLEKLTLILKPDDMDSDSNRFSFSAGIVEAKHLEVHSFDEAISIADYCMYEAKDKGKGNIVIAAQQQVDDYRLTNYIKSHLERTCKTMGFVPFFQPFIDGKTGKVKGFETLVRMKIGGGFAPNDHLINQARELNLLKQIDTQMFEENLKFAKFLMDQGLADESWIFNSNFSAHTLSRIKVEDLYEMTKIYGISPEQVVIEITEDELLEKSIQTFLQNYKKYKFKIAIDDFGAAYSSFVRLLEIKPDIMKIDRSLLTMDISSNSDVQNLYNNMIHLGRDLNSTITAEGVESTDQMALLQSLGVETLQGFHFSKPLPKEEFIIFVQNHD